ncbi:DUF6538 domain-containing protein [Bosea sp. (in: a-proteobacteria)]|uniref:DUF6538 domain-containing protein n=1 Tax=Bosea sp. (in: a-proteobacteria) TaxID=1871050 RepID=UPI0025B9019B|nr:DUF6538 domain-containing protein [Bosea sp. (in: a-proteobacteria)]
MAVASHLERRGSVYYWRRRLPEVLAQRLNQRCIVVSLRTRERKSARYLAAQLDAAAEKMMASPPAQWITKDQLKDFFRRSFAIHEEIIRRADSMPGSGPVDIDLDRRAAQYNGWAFRIIAERGLPACVDDADRERMRDDGCSEAVIATVEGLVKWYGAPARVAHMTSSIAQILDQVGAPATADNVARVEKLYARAQSEAAFATIPSETDEFDIAALVEDVRAAPPDILRPRTGAVVSRATAMEHIGEYFEELRPAVAVAAPKPDRSVLDTARDLAEDKKAAEEWTEKTASQFLSICDLFARFMSQELKLRGVSELESKHLLAFNRFLLHDIAKSYGKSPSDLTATITHLKDKAGSMAPGQRGLSAGTRARHYTFLDQLLGRARMEGSRIDPQLKFSDHKPKASGRAREEREIPKQATIAELFKAPVFHGCKSWERPFEPGERIHHRAAYFGPLFAYYHGMRREEFCGLTVDDLRSVTEEGEAAPHIKVWDNTIRRLKNDQSRRFLPIHPELLRLGIMQYAARIKELGYTHLFPELRSPTSRSPLGDRYYDEWSQAKLAGTSAHPLRHAFNDELKQSRVTEEMRADMMGHGGKSETSERYANAFKLSAQAQDMEKIPVLTSSIPVAAISIIPWVEAQQDAPWSRPSRKKVR